MLAKLAVLSAIGLASPRILKKINTRRNLLEHRYETVQQREAEDATDVATLFVEAVHRYTACRYCELEFETSHKGSWVVVTWDFSETEEHSIGSAEESQAPIGLKVRLNRDTCGTVIQPTEGATPFFEQLSCFVVRPKDEGNDLSLLQVVIKAISER